MDSINNQLGIGGLIPLMSVSITFLGLIFVGILGQRFLKTWEMRGSMQLEVESQRLELEKSRLAQEEDKSSGKNTIHIDNSSRDNENSNNDNDNGGYAFIDIEENKKDLFTDALMGFEDYANLRGYNVKVHINTSINSKIGLKIVINDYGVTVSREKVKNDAAEFVRKIMTDEDFSDVPMTHDPIRHGQIVGALNMRHALLRQRALLSDEKAESYREILGEMREFTKTVVTYAKSEPSSYIQIEAKGGSTMRDKFTIKESPGAIAGRDNVSVGNQINIGNTATEKANRIVKLQDLIDTIEQSDIGGEKKKAIVRYLENAKEEIDVSSQPDKTKISGWLEKAKSTLALAEAAPKVIEIADKVFNMFFDGNSASSITV